MHHFAFKSILKGFASVLIVATPLFSTVIDGAFDDNKNNFEYSWYYYDDTRGVGKDDRLQVSDPGTPSLIRVPSKDSTRSDGKTIKNYTFTTGEQCSNKYATLPFVIGSSWVATYGPATPFVGIGTMLASNGKSIDISSATEIKFKIRSHQGTKFSVRFQIQTLDMDVYSERDVPPPGAFAYFGVDIDSVTTCFTEHTFSIPTDFEQPGWAATITTAGFPTTLDLSHTSKISWEIGNAKPGTIDTLDIDDITLPSPWDSKTIWTETVPLTPLPTTGEFATFDRMNPSETPLGTSWYAYSDRQIGGTSDITIGAVNQNNGRYELQFNPKTGSSDTTQGAAIDFTIGPTVTQDSITMGAYAGIGCNLYDSAKSTYWNAQNAQAQSIYFHYSADTDCPYVTFEVSDFYDVADANRPTNKDGRGRPHIIWYINLPNTGGDWKAVLIPFSKLVCHGDWPGAKDIPLDITRLAKVQWKIQGPEGSGGVIAIDNVFFLQSSLQSNCLCVPGTTDVKHSLHSVKPSTIFNVQFLSGNMHISFNNNAAIKHGTISFFNAKGRLILSASFANSNNFTTNFTDKKFLSGVYFVKINAVDVNGRKVIAQSSVNILR